VEAVDQVVLAEAVDQAVQVVLAEVVVLVEVVDQAVLVV
jgi:hypothetical protein